MWTLGRNPKQKMGKLVQRYDLFLPLYIKMTWKSLEAKTFWFFWLILLKWAREGKWRFCEGRAQCWCLYKIWSATGASSDQLNGWKLFLVPFPKTCWKCSRWTQHVLWQMAADQTGSRQGPLKNNLQQKVWDLHKTRLIIWHQKVTMSLTWRNSWRKFTDSLHA